MFLPVRVDIFHNGVRRKWTALYNITQYIDNVKFVNYDNL